MSKILSALGAVSGEVQDFRVIVIGHLKWNPHFGETQDAPPRGDPSTCTSVLLRGQKDGKPFVLVMDPTIRNAAEDYHFDIFRRTGLRPEAITHCFISHCHFDHYAGVTSFPNAQWLTSPETAKRLESQPVGSRLKPVTGEFLPGVFSVNLPGHTMDLCGLAFRFQGLRVIAAADSVMTEDHFFFEDGMFEEDKDLARETLREEKKWADIVVPGHGNVIVNRFSANGF
ncbi:MAG: MBL fold metallo-hydrolase [Clostridiales bacterium]|jgi:glyoxylase-like metal-dependent hydrolase (beta-lactamase superfamily II)|nr:MBL fold metallo-hydrolase [Clostridiales bacterium]